MKRISVATIAVVVLWFGLSTAWMAGSGATQATAPASQPQSVHQAPQSCAMMASMGGGADTNAAMLPGGGMSSPQQSLMLAPDANFVGDAPLNAPISGIMTDPVAPILGLDALFATPPPASDVMTRLKAVEDKLAAALLRLEVVGDSDVPVTMTTVADNPPAPTSLSQPLSVLTSGPVIGFLLILLVILALTARGRTVFQGAAKWLQRFPKVQAAVRRQRDQAQTYLRLTGLDTPQGRSAHWTRILAQADRLQQAVHTRAVPLLARLRQSTSRGANQTFGNTPRVYGEVMRATDMSGQALTAGVFEEGQVRAAAGLTLALGAMAFTYAYFAQIYGPIQFVTTLFFVEFLIRVTAGIRYSPMGMIAHWMTRRQPPQWVSAQPKRFAWTLGLVMSLAMMIITNSGIRGPLPLTICLICRTLMWLEAVLGLCLGCEIHRFLVRRGWIERDVAYEICANGACAVDARP